MGGVEQVSSNWSPHTKAGCFCHGQAIAQAQMGIKDLSCWTGVHRSCCSRKPAVSSPTLCSSSVCICDGHLKPRSSLLVTSWDTLCSHSWKFLLSSWQLSSLSLFLLQLLLYSPRSGSLGTEGSEDTVKQLKQLFIDPKKSSVPVN